MAQLTVIIPAYNEHEALPILLDRLDLTLSKAKIAYKAIVVDDHSTDGTVAAISKLTKKYPLQIVMKKGVRGKAQSIFEGVALATTEFVVMLDADLQYPPEAIPEMMAYAKDGNHGVVVARRKVYDESMIRKVGSRSLAFVCGKLLHGFSCDIQSGLKLFKKEILSYVDTQDVTPWSLDLPLLHTAKELGFTIGEIEIDFVKRTYGSSKLSLFGPTVQIINTAIKLKFRRIEAEQTEPTRKGSMTGAGVRYKGKHFITHSTLHHSKSAMTVITPSQRSFLLVLLGICLIGLGLNALFTIQVFVAILSFIYFVDVIFNFFLILKSLHSPPEISPTNGDIALLKDKDLPVYTILCPLYKEAHVIPQFVEAISALDWPKNKLEVMLLLEEDDVESVEAVKHMNLPGYIRAVVVPDSQPKTKPKACNYGLNLAKGEYVVIYDAEDKPDVNQLKKAYIAFQIVGPEVKCLQAKLNYYNPNQNWLTRLFTAEYSLWFDVILTGLQSIGTTIPLGGTSNHFRTSDLLDFEGWDPFNVTEDCDLGVRLFKKGAKTAIIDSTTLEEANSNFRNWIRQRSRWIKGYMQTYLLHMRDPKGFADGQGIHALLFQLTVGGKIAFILINPILWVLTIAYFVLYRFVGPTIESLYPTVVFYMAVTSLIFGNFMFIYYYMIGAAKREHWGLMKWIYLIPFYWLMVSIAGAMALYQLIVKPHYWEKTIHGLHLKKVVKDVALETMTEVILQEKAQKLPSSAFFKIRTSIYQNLAKVFKRRSYAQIFSKLKDTKYRDGLFLVAATMLANVLNMLTNVYMGRQLRFADFAVMNTFISLLYLLGIPLSALSATVNIKASSLFGKHGVDSARLFWQHIRRRALFLGLIFTGIWILLSPFLSTFLHMPNVLPMLLFSPLIVVGFISAVDTGYLRGRLFFGALALSVALEPIVRLISIVTFGELHQYELIFLSIPLATIASALVTYWYSRPGTDGPRAMREFKLPVGFFSQALVSKLSTIAFFSLDNVIVAHFMSATETGEYALLGLIGKMIFFAGSLSAGFILPIVSNREGKGESSDDVFDKLLMITAVLSILAHVALGLVLPVISPYFFGDKLNTIREMLPIYGLGILLYTISQSVVQFHLAKKEYEFSIISFGIAMIQIVGLWLFHSSVMTVVIVMAICGVLNAVILLFMHYFYPVIRVPLQNIRDFLELFGKLPKGPRVLEQKANYRILIFNWRDTKHRWAGGAEQYIHEISKQLIASGHSVTLFCGNDGRHDRNEIVDGVRVIRRGGFYTVYIWAFLYYIVRLRKTVDIVIDCENGIPFLTPLYVSHPIFLLIHHIHQDVFREHLRFPFSEVAAYIESDVMPRLYARHSMITVSESSKQDMIDLGLGDAQSIDVVNPGINTSLFRRSKKTTVPSIAYIGRLKPYKNIDVAIKAFSKVLKKYPKAHFSIAGSGESYHALVKLTQRLKIQDRVEFLSTVSDAEKAAIFSRSWLVVQPSMVEGWGITVIEANASGTPVIASDVKGLRDSVNDNETGILVNPSDVDALESAMLTLFKNTSKREQLSENALKWSKKFGWQKSSEKFLQVIEKKVGRSLRTINRIEKAYEQA